MNRPISKSAATATLLLLLTACASQSPRTTGVSHCATGVATSARSVSTPARLSLPAVGKLVFVSFDGLGADQVAKYRSTFSSDGFLAVAENGTTAGRVIPVNPTLTSVAHSSLITGATPEVTGVASNSFHVPGTAVNAWASGFDAPIGAETLWQAARRAGKRVGVITYPGVDNTTPERAADWGMIYTQQLTRPKLVRLSSKDFKAEWLPPGWTNGSTFSPARAAVVRWELPKNLSAESVDVQLVATDSTNDGAQNYDRIEVRYAGKSTGVDSARWFAVQRDLQVDGGNYRYGSWSKLLRFEPSLNEVVVYWGGVHRNEGYPESYRRMIDERVGFWPGAPDEWLSGEWIADPSKGIDPQTFSEQVTRFSNFFTTATIESMKSMPFDLLLAYQPIVDESEHQFRLESSLQKGYSERTRTAGDQVIGDAYRLFDRAVASISKALPAGTALAITGDHGLAPLDTSVRLNRLLSDWGYVKLKGRQFEEASPWTAFSSGSYTILYANAPGALESREEIVKRLRELRAPDGDLVFDRVVATTAATNHPNSGQITATAKPRFALTSNVDGPVFEPSPYFGQHGGLNYHCALHTIFSVAGPGIPKQRIEILEQTSIARIVSKILGIDPPRQSAPLLNTPVRLEGKATALPGSLPR